MLNAFRRFLTAILAALVLAPSAIFAQGQEPREPGETIIVSGGVSLWAWEKWKTQPHDNWWMNFIRAARIRIQQVKAANPEQPVTWLDESNGSGYWAVLKHRDIIEVSRDVETFTSRAGIRLEQRDADETAARRTLMEMDPPEHTRLRRLVSKVFTRRIVETYEEQIRQLAVEVIERAIEHD